jgi:hypothetical protein
MIAKLFKSKSHNYPLMRDPKGNPKCYELTDQEREEAARQVDQLLQEKTAKQTQTYYGA